MATTHARRTPEQIVADFEAKIAAVKARAAAKQAKASPEGAAFLVAARAVLKAIEAATAAKNQQMVAALEAARAELSKHAVETGARMPQARQRVIVRRRKGTAE